MPTQLWPRYNLSQTTFERKLKKFFPEQKDFQIKVGILHQLRPLTSDAHAVPRLLVMITGSGHPDH